MDTDTGIEIKNGAAVVDIPIEALAAILEQYPDLVVSIGKEK